MKEKLYDNFISYPLIFALVPLGTDFKLYPYTFGFEFSYKGVELSLRISNDNRCWISYAAGHSTILQDTCNTMEDLEKMFWLLDQLTLNK